MSSPCRGSSHLSLALLCSLSVTREYLALRDGPRRFTPGSTCPVLLRIRLGHFAFRIRDYHPLWSNFPECSAKLRDPRYRPTTPEGMPSGLGCSAFARRYLRSRFFFLFLQVLRCFSSLRWIGYPGINARLTATPGLSQSSTPMLLVPRHPPHALSSLAAFIPSSNGVFHHSEKRFIDLCYTLSSWE